MPARKITMRKVKEILRLSLDSRLPYDQIAQALGLSKGVISKYTRQATAAGLDWPAIEAMNEGELQRCQTQFRFNTVIKRIRSEELIHRFAG